ncbi:MAG TPA: tRNA lysidine(34) synthetase TilS [Jatrophihabitantaceae bacterium]|jgi:tRNA(Ile)-lysidine synthase|nr:tRNA lysidine(34) synthetase TilS [Jatrophihabitantaceae bacterium]
MGPHPAVAEIRLAVRTALAGLDDDRTTLLVACSGGADSLALAAAAAFEAPRAGRRAALVTIDHGLQPGSHTQAASVAALGYELGFDPVETLVVHVGRDGGPEAAARAARYRALDAAAEAHGADVLLGHTLDDQAETVLLGLGRGSGPRSIAGMAARSGRYVRPLLGVRRATTEAACTALGLSWWDDPHNADPAFQRVRLRREVLPLLDDVLQGGVAEALARTADLIRADLEALDALINSPSAVDAAGWSAVDHQMSLAVDGLAGLPRAVRSRMLRDWAVANGIASLTAVHTAALDALITAWHGQGPVDVPGGRQVRRASGRLEVTP